MKLVTLKDEGKSGTRLGLVQDGRILPFNFPGGMLGLIQAGPEALALVADRTAAGASIELADTALAAPIANPSKIMAIGKNYADHAIETKSAIPESPIVFAKFPTTIIGPAEEITWDPGLTAKVDFEAELAVIIGKPARRVSEAEALNYVFGYTCANDISARDLQYGDKQWVRGK